MFPPVDKHDEQDRLIRGHVVKLAHHGVELLWIPKRALVVEFDESKRILSSAFNLAARGLRVSSAEFARISSIRPIGRASNQQRATEREPRYYQLHVRIVLKLNKNGLR
jgi:hypothetical protein